MRVAVISDVHGNAHALEAVLEAIDRERPDALWCLGDTVGYGPRPNECCSTVQQRADVCLVGNHDLLALGKTVLAADFNPDAAVSGSWTRAALTDDSRSFLRALEPQAQAAGAALYHASARDPVWEYVLSGEAALATLELAPAPLVLVGHSHVPLAISLTGATLVGGHAPGGTEIDFPAGRTLLNPGSVGQPRDGDARAAWLLLETERGHAAFRRVAYDVAATQDEIREAGLPESLAARLTQGI